MLPYRAQKVNEWFEDKSGRESYAVTLRIITKTPNEGTSVGRVVAQFQRLGESMRKSAEAVLRFC